jgi:hypothetical protein
LVDRLHSDTTLDQSSKNVDDQTVIYKPYKIFVRHFTKSNESVTNSSVRHARVARQALPAAHDSCHCHISSDDEAWLVILDTDRDFARTPRALSWFWLQDSVLERQNGFSTSDKKRIIFVSTRLTRRQTQMPNGLVLLREVPKGSVHVNFSRVLSSSAPHPANTVVAVD